MTNCSALTEITLLQDPAAQCSAPEASEKLERRYFQSTADQPLTWRNQAIDQFPVEVGLGRKPREYPLRPCFSRCIISCLGPAAHLPDLQVIGLTSASPQSFRARDIGRVIDVTF